MKIFLCPSCHQVVYFESVSCTSCGARLGFSPVHQMIIALELAPPAIHEPPSRDRIFQALGPSRQPLDRGVRLCANYAEHGTCNWTVPADEGEAYCRSCRLNEVIPDLGAPGAQAAWARLEAAKRRLLYTLLSLDLPLASRRQDPGTGLGFVFKQQIPGGEPVVTGHADGIITINVAEADDAQREKTRTQLGEKYRSLLGHFRHESGHFYWSRLIPGSAWQEEFRSRFGDERADYDAALQHHYEQGPPPYWYETYVSPYAAVHPWEDWAESWAHYLHMVDTLETARCYGIALRPQPAGGTPAENLALRSVSLREFDAMLAAWIPLTLALNDFNRGMGLPDLYPFALPTAAVEKIAFVHHVIRGRQSPRPAAPVSR